MKNGKVYFYYPLTITSDLNSISLNKSLVLRKITDYEIKTFFGIENRKLSKNYFLESCNTIQGSYYPLGDVAYHILANTYSIFSSNYVLVSQKGTQDAQLFNWVLKLLLSGRSGVHIGFNSKSPALEFIHPNPYFKVLEISSLNKNDEKELKSLFLKIQRLSSNSLFKLLLDLYLSSISGNVIRDETRFVDLMTVLEILYLGNNEGELKYRLSIRIAKTFSSYYEENPQATFDVFNKVLYKIRSEIVHTGRSKSFTSEELKTLIEFVRKSLLLFVKDPEIYKSENLNTLVLS